jgi:hypothetical protein
MNRLRVLYEHGAPNFGQGDYQNRSFREPDINQDYAIRKNVVLCSCKETFYGVQRGEKWLMIDEQEPEYQLVCNALSRHERKRKLEKCKKMQALGLHCHHCRYPYYYCRTTHALSDPSTLMKMLTATRSFR